MLNPWEAQQRPPIRERYSRAKTSVFAGLPADKSLSHRPGNRRLPALGALLPQPLKGIKGAKTDRRSDEAHY